MTLSRKLTEAIKEFAREKENLGKAVNCAEIAKKAGIIVSNPYMCLQDARDELEKEGLTFVKQGRSHFVQKLKTVQNPVVTEESALDALEKYLLIDESKPVTFEKVEREEEKKPEEPPKPQQIAPPLPAKKDTTSGLKLVDTEIHIQDLENLIKFFGSALSTKTVIVTINIKTKGV